MASLVVFVALCLLPWSALSHAIDSGDLGVESQFSDFKQTFNRDYESQEEEAMRFEIFKENLQKAAERNRNAGGQVHGVTKFSDWTAEEFKGMLGSNMSSVDDSYCKNVKIPSGNTPDTLDYVDLGKVSPVKDQDVPFRCGSCWSFSATGQLESQVLIKYNKNVSLSEQQLMDCDTNSHGCGGTNSMTYAPEYFVENGSELDEDYTYEANDGQCRYNPSKVAVKVASCSTYPTNGDESYLKNILKEVGPVSIGVAADDWFSYTGGIMTDCSAPSTDHAVLLVGYGTEGGVDYWKVKNSWGPSFGEQGYIRLQRGTNQCQLKRAPVVGTTVA